MPSQAPWSPTAHAFAQHQFNHVTNFWRQGRHASFRLEALPGGQAELNLTFKLPSAYEVIPPPTHVPLQRPIHPLFPNGCFSQEADAGSKTKHDSPKKASSRRRKSYQRSVLHRATLAAHSLPPPTNGSLRQVALAAVQRQQTIAALQMNTQSAKKRPLPNSPNGTSPLHIPPLAQRIRKDIQIGESEVVSPEKEVLRTPPFQECSPVPFSPCLKDIPSPAPLFFTPVSPEKPKCLNCEGEMTPDHQCEELPPPLPLCHICCHRGSGDDPVHYFVQCICDDRDCTCWCYCTEAQLKVKQKVYPGGFFCKNCFIC